jgi:hypothetical protein
VVFLRIGGVGFGVWFLIWSASKSSCRLFGGWWRSLRRSHPAVCGGRSLIFCWLCCRGVCLLGRGIVAILPWIFSWWLPGALCLWVGWMTVVEVVPKHVLNSDKPFMLG